MFLAQPQTGDHRAVGRGVLVQRNDLSTFHSVSPLSDFIKEKDSFCPESSGRTSCLVMSAVPPELPDVSGRSRALLFKRCPCNAGPAAHLLNGRRTAVFSLLLPGVRSRGARARLSAVPHSLGRTTRATFPVPCICCFKIARWRHFVNLTVRHRTNFCVFACQNAFSLVKSECISTARFVSSMEEIILYA